MVTVAYNMYNVWLYIYIHIHIANNITVPLILKSSSYVFNSRLARLKMVELESNDSSQCDTRDMKESNAWVSRVLYSRANTGESRVIPPSPT